MWHVYGRDVGDRRYFDLKRVLTAGTPASGAGADYRVHVGTLNRIDLGNARRLRGVPGLRLYEHSDGGHRLVRTLRDNGELAQILRDAIVGSG
jgi:hypothetical protein